MRRCLTLFVLVTILCTMTLGCTIGPVTKHEFILVRPGKPIEVLQNVKVRGRRLGDNGVAKTRIGGWITMPREHWDLIQKRLENQ